MRLLRCFKYNFIYAPAVVVKRRDVLVNVFLLPTELAPEDAGVVRSVRFNN